MSRIKEIKGIENVTITTNGVLLEKMYDQLADAGIDAITVSLDTLDPGVFRTLTRRDESERVQRGLEMAIRKGRVPLKINCVPVMGMEEQQLTDIALIARDNPVHVRFIEMMPIGMGSQFPFVREDEIRASLENKFGVFTPCNDVTGNGPCHYFAVKGFKGRIGFISAVSHKFCGECNRVRLTAEGFLKTCLQYDCGVALKPLLRSGASDDELERAILHALKNKPLGHSFGGGERLQGRELRGMSQIGG